MGGLREAGLIADFFFVGFRNTEAHPFRRLSKDEGKSVA